MQKLLGSVTRRFGGASKRNQAFQWLKRIAFYYPFTLPGTLLFFTALYLIGKAFATQNPYGFLLSVVALAALAIFAGISRAQASRFRNTPVEWESTIPLYAASPGLEHFIYLENIRALPFFRIHFTLTGKMQVGRGASMYPHREVSSRGGERVGIPLHFPLCGVFEARGRFTVQDAFGLTRARFGDTLERTITVRPALLQERVFPTVEALDGMEEKSKFKQSDIERYFMREYIPGDRIRDINWKASSRFSELVTRISPVTQEKTRILSIFFRPVRKKSRETATSVAHLNYIKSWLLLFLKTVKQVHPEYQFNLIVGSESTFLETEEDIDQFGLDLSSLFFRYSAAEFGASLAAEVSGDAFVFTTPYDASLLPFLGGFAGSRVFLFRTVPPDPKSSEAPRKITLFAGHSSVLVFGAWAFVTERRLQNPSLSPEQRSYLLEESLDVQLA